MYTDKVPEQDEKDITSTLRRYVDADALLEDLKHSYCLSCKKVNTFFCWNTCDVSDIINDVLNYEPADVAPVVHGSWIKKEDCSVVTDIPWSMCSACGSYSLKLPYYAFCGAKMDEVIE